MLIGVFDDQYPWLRAAVASAGIAILIALVARDVARDRNDLRRAKEYAFLAATTLAAVVYGVVHDHITATLSPEYFLVAKGLAGDPRPWRVAVTLLAVRASWWTGLAIGAAMLVANNPRSGGKPPQLSYTELGRLAVVPVVGACVGAVCGAVNGLDPFGLGASVEAYVAPDRVKAFLMVWGVHAGSYAGGVAGAVRGVWMTVRRRRLADAELPASPR